MWFVNMVFTVLNLVNGNISLIKSVVFTSFLTVAIGAYLKLAYDERNVTLKQTLIYRFCQLKIKFWIVVYIIGYIIGYIGVLLFVLPFGVSMMLVEEAEDKYSKINKKGDKQ
jgi:hypothetical protein